MADHGQSPILDQTPPPEAIRHEIEVDHSIVEIGETNGEDPLDSGFKEIILEMANHIAEIFTPLEAIKDEIERKKRKDLLALLDQISGTRFRPGPRFRPTSIFKVHVGLRESNTAAYTPKLISIGPYHNQSPNLPSMEKYKRLYLQRFLNRKEGIDKGSCLRELEKLKDKALMCYDDKENLDKDISKFLEIMLIDGCFLVEFIRERCGILPRGEEPYQPVIGNAWMINQVCRDMVVLENQLPFFVLTMLHDMTCPNEEIFLYMVIATLLCISPKKTYIAKSGSDCINAEQIDHLLHMLHMLSCPPKMKRSKEIPHRPSPPRPSEIKSSEGKDASKKKGFCNINIFLGKILQKMKRSKEIPDDPNIRNIPSATELYEAGVSFTKIGSVEEDDKDTATLLDIKFENGLLEIPCFLVGDSTETILRNLIAYEQHSSNVNPYFSDYQHIMDQLINSPKDVKLLRESGVIINYLGDDKAVAKIFNKLGDGVLIDATKSYYKEERRKLNQHCQKSRNKIMANLRHNYFHSLWAGTSTVAAIVLLILTAMQTVLAFTGSVK